ncbi:MULTISPECIES: LPS export ABC transporter periplasmic protein LptC [Chromobacterium]|uniref:LPS export ABC transporter periplasmic protein LptC n=2 Tax=Chromobacterium TaxID=535 RepID=A0A1W0DB05_9NEIS|nr:MULTISPECIES: LPS export ABC transporter periplasmic protein LptC [Chromobacterium]AXT45464.1 LPS export ABC transporter periplasmic protein LptC [Chromobacterium rhizoryzae]MDH0341744.1 LPS export ABC transporter periplasmic protein LptC [Chromobacterium haemolyticum]OQS44199.1 LPS export ABC transporter periplasmic protein LptC [Chromobacterium haemolyticum]QOD83735.1 LPS export ABC transporter periplasmic protein LptC [Chromobacterium haemolyticum]QOZ85286.1 LPS export ABC transporter pe
MIRLLRSHRLFPLLLVGLTGLLTVWLDQVSRWDSNRRELDPDKPEYVAEHLTATRFDAQGKLNERLIATRMWQYPGKDDAFFENPELYQYQQGALQYQLIGDVGRYNNKTQQAYFDKKATMIQPAAADKPETKVVTSAMHVDTAKKIARSAAPTVFYHGKSHGNSVGFVYQQQTGLLNLLSHTKIIYEK